jgi:hypothetical protein
MYSQTLLSPMSTNSIGVICDKISTILHYWTESLLQAIKGNVLLWKFEITAFNCIYIILYSYVRICYFSPMDNQIRIGKKKSSSHLIIFLEMPIYQWNGCSNLYGHVEMKFKKDL